jgi:hypothetical protein
MKKQRGFLTKIIATLFACAVYSFISQTVFLVYKKGLEQFPLFCFPGAFDVLKMSLMIFAPILALLIILYCCRNDLLDHAVRSTMLLFMATPLFLLSLVFPTFGILSFLKVFLIFLPLVAIFSFLFRAYESQRNSLSRFSFTFSGKAAKRISIAVAVASFILVSFLRTHYMPFLSKSADCEYLTGDEPHYLLIAKSLAHDYDFDLANNIENKDYASYYNQEIGGHCTPSPDAKRYSGHRLGLPLLLVPAIRTADKFGFGDRPAAAIILNLLFCILCMQIFIAAFELSGSMLAALAAWAGTCLALPLSVYSSQIFPELPAALIVFLAFRGITPLSKISRPGLFLTSLCIAYLPWLHEKYIIITIAFALLFFARFRKEKKPMIIFSVLMAASAALQFWYYQIVYHSFLPSASTHEALVNPNGAILGLLGSLLDSGNGIFVLCPFLLLAVPGLLSLVRKKDHLHVFSLLLLILSIYIPCGIYTDWWAGFCPQGRYLVPVIPLMVFFIVPGILASRDFIVRLLFLTALAYSIFAGIYSFFDMMVLYTHRFPFIREAPFILSYLPDLIFLPDTVSLHLVRGFFWAAAILVFFITASLSTLSRFKEMKKRISSVLIILVMLAFVLFDILGLNGPKGEGLHFAGSFFRSAAWNRQEKTIYPEKNIPYIESYKKYFVPAALFCEYSQNNMVLNRPNGFAVKKIVDTRTNNFLEYIESSRLYDIVGSGLMEITLSDIKIRDRLPRSFVDILTFSDDTIIERYILNLREFYSKRSSLIVVPYNNKESSYVWLRISTPHYSEFVIKSVMIRPLLRELPAGKYKKRKAMQLCRDAEDLLAQGKKQEAIALLDKSQRIWPVLENPKIILDSLGKKTRPFSGKPLAVYENSIALMDFQIRKYKNSHFLELTYLWKCLEETKTNYAVFVHFVSDGGKVFLQNDHFLDNNLKPTDFFVKDELVEEKHLLPFDPEKAKIRLEQIRIGLWDPVYTKKRAEITFSKMETEGNSVIIRNITY